MNINESISAIKEKLDHQNKKSFLIAVDGRCAAGKTTFANMLKQEIDCNIIRTDHFFLRAEQRTKQRYEEPGGNFDRERLIEEVMVPLSQRQSFSYSVFDCGLMELSEEIYIKHKAVTIIEGSYSCHPDLWDYYDLRIFLSIDREKQINRIMQRNGIKATDIFLSKWIPLEEKYFSSFDIMNRCDLVAKA